MQDGAVGGTASHGVVQRLEWTHRQSLKDLQIIVLWNFFDPDGFSEDDNDEKLGALEQMVHAECKEMGTVEKITVFLNILPLCYCQVCSAECVQ